MIQTHYKRIILTNALSCLGCQNFWCLAVLMQVKKETSNKELFEYKVIFFNSWKLVRSVW